MKGTVKFYNDEKGFGFITEDESGKDVFVHSTALGDLSISEGDKVEFEEEQGEKGPKAVKIKKI